MNTLDIGKRIYTLRKEKHITQEQLAKSVGLSTPAVSKWETGNAYPDITLLAPLARVLGTTIDDLLSYEAELSESDADKIIKEISACFENHGYRAGYKKSREYLEEYPNSDLLKLKTGSLTIKYMYTIEEDYTEEEHRNVIKDNIKLYEQVKSGKDKTLSMTACVCLVTAYMSMGEYDKAEELLNQFPKEEINAKRLYPTLYLLKDNLEEAAKLSGQTLLSDLQNVLSSMLTLHSIAILKKDYKKAFQYANDYLTMVKEFKLKANEAIGYDILIKTYFECDDLMNAAAYFSKYVDAILSICSDDYSYDNHPYFSNISSKELTGSREIIAKKSLLKSILITPYYKKLEDTKEYKEGIKRLKAAIDN